MESHGQRIGRTVKHLRVTAGLTQEKLAYRADISVMTVRRLEAGRHMPHTATLRALADALGVTVSHLLGEPEVAA